MNARIKTLSIIMSVAMAVAFCPGLAAAAPGGGPSHGAVPEPSMALAPQDGNIASGTWGTCPWEIDAQGTLTVHPGVGASQEGAFMSLWSAYHKCVKGVVFSPLLPIGVS